ncbi:MAG: Pectic acid lyase [Polyangiaceae bacterium]|nr:Pectic acid lyase [Polyangiaceae bacterium]
MRFPLWTFGLAGLVLLGVNCSSSPPPAPEATAGAGSAGAGGSTASTGGGGAGSGSGGVSPGAAGDSVVGVAGAAAGGVAGSDSGGAGGVSAECGVPSSAAVTVAWDAVNKQPEAFYASAEARALAENVVYYQNADHGWPKNVDMTTRAAPKGGSTIDNRGTTTQIELLARVYEATRCPRYGEAMLSGVKFLLAAQYDNGGWPQVYPNPTGYHKHITFNDDAMIHVLTVLRAIARGDAPYGSADMSLRTTASAAVARGVECILACQIKMEGGQRGWCAQHDEVTLAPAQARTYELPSVSGSEGARIVRFLMTIEPTTPEIQAAVEGAVAWFQAVKLTGFRVNATTDASQPTGEDRVVVQDPAASPLWARFYELGTNKPIFSSRCEVPECDEDPFYMRRYSLAEIENERRVGYSWYGNWPAAVLTEYQAWKAKHP